MQRWNGWGDEKTNYPVPPITREYISDILGDKQTLPDAPLESVIQKLPASRVDHLHFLSIDPLERIMHSCGQSLPDWINLRSGRIPRLTDGIIYPHSVSEISRYLKFAYENDFILIPYGGGTSVVGHINPPLIEAPVITLDLSRMNMMLDIDQASHLATFEAGIKGPDIESALRKHGYTLGHFPQSFEYSSLGGWIATRSCGQQSYHYGRIEDLFKGGQLLTPLGEMDLPPFPASAAGPDLRQIILGSEGRLGIISKAIVRIEPLPVFEDFYGVFFRDWQSGLTAIKKIAQRGIQVSMLRLSDPQETAITLLLSGKGDLVRYAGFGLSKLGFRSGRCLLIMGVTGGKNSTYEARQAALRVCRKHGGLYTGNYVGRSWRKSRFLVPYLRNSLWDLGYALDTLETAVPWSEVVQIKRDTMQAITQASESQDQPVLVFGHISHVYKDGASIYITYVFRRSSDPEENLERWQKMKNAASEAIINHGGTISHQHGVGHDHARHLQAEKGSLGMDLLKEIYGFFDPKGVLNPNHLIERDDRED